MTEITMPAKKIEIVNEIRIPITYRFFLKPSMKPSSYKLTIIDNFFEIKEIHEWPNPWHRFWQRMLLGWHWEKVSRDE